MAGDTNVPGKKANNDSLGLETEALKGKLMEERARLNDGDRKFLNFLLKPSKDKNYFCIVAHQYDGSIGSYKIGYENFYCSTLLLLNS